MSEQNVEEAQRAWQEILDETALDEHPPDRLGFTGVEYSEKEWIVRFTQELEARVPRAETIRELLDDLKRTGLDALVGPHEVEHELAHRTAVEVRHRRSPSWDSARAQIESDLRRGVAAVAVGGVYVGSAVADNGCVAVQLGPDALAVHLDETAEAEIAALARAHGLLGFRFSMDSWWAEEVISGREDPQVGAELIESYGDDSWPWLAIASVLPAAGPAAEAGGCAVATALLGALILLDHPPADPWCGAVPWIAGGLTFTMDSRRAGGCDTNLGIYPQRVDAGVRKLDTAESTETIGRFGAAIDIAAHAVGPASELLAAVVASARGNGSEEAGEAGAIARACALAWHAAAAEPGAVRALISSSLIEQLMLASKADADPRSLAELVEAGGRWRMDEDGIWPQGRRWVRDPNFEQFFAELAADATQHDDLLPHGGGWCASEAAASSRLLDIAQVALFGIAALERD